MLADGQPAVYAHARLYFFWRLLKAAALAGVTCRWLPLLFILFVFGDPARRHLSNEYDDIMAL